LAAALGAPFPLRAAGPRSEKPCTKCSEVKPLEDFNVDSRNRDGRRAVCRTCRYARQRDAYTMPSSRVIATR
jgi:hypothetical protein